MPLALPRRAAGLLPLVALSACNRPPPPFVALPADPNNPFADLARQGILHTAYAFADPQRLAGRPAEAAQAIAEAEFLAIDLSTNQRWTEMQPLVQIAFLQARPEWRGALGITEAAEPQAVIDAMTRVRMGIGAQDGAAAGAALQPPLVMPGGAASLARLAALPALPRTAWAAAMAQNEMWRIQRQGGRDRWR
ncbi:hypothetical protein [Roseomonas sp. CECT 9278]|uniref:hypothetical protein n=1 Tax=Roseomonas sp. CECT 9278 TaxID=2845823 RepID=UPI001E438085|nr:hypothetical protein [Roseomonas sp. CECT 9278]CAH0275070.1 hypothetical protein ROS9278_03776 [Roseomonas sp. CECT 9278]